MKQFVMSEYGTKEMLYKAKAEYYEKLFLGLRETLVEIKVFERANDEGDYTLSESFKRWFSGDE